MNAAPSSMVRVPKAEGRMSSQAEPAKAGPIERSTPASESAPRVPMDLPLFDDSSIDRHYPPQRGFLQ